MKKETLFGGIAVLFVAGLLIVNLWGQIVAGYQDFAQIATPGNPSSTCLAGGPCGRVYISSGASGKLSCLLPSGASCAPVSGALSLETNGTANGSQSLLNLAAGSNMTLTDNGSGTVTFASSGGGGSTPQSSWTVVNGAVLSNLSGLPFVGVYVPSNPSLNWRFVERALTIPYTVIAAISCQQPNPAVNATDCGFYLTDGTKLEGFEMLGLSAGAAQLRVETMNSVTSDNATPAGPTANLAGWNNFEAKIVNDSTHRTFYYYSAGAWVQFLQEASGTWLTETDIGFGGVSQTTAVDLVSANLTYYSGP